MSIALTKLPYNKLVEISDNRLVPMFRTAVGDVIKIKGTYQLSITLSDNHEFVHTFLSSNIWRMAVF